MNHGTHSLTRTIGRQRLAFTGLAGSLILVLGLGAQQAPAPPEPAYVAGGERIYRINSDRTIDYIEGDLAQGTDDGIPGWARLRVDHSLTRDRMGNVTRAGRR